MSSITFAQFISNTNAVKFGDFTLKSGEKSNVFFDFGALSYGSELYRLGCYIADFIMVNSLDRIDALFGPAYKGINIALATSIALYQKYNTPMPFTYNRKGEGGELIGHDLSEAKSVVVLDDVFTDGGTKYETIKMLSRFKRLTIKAFIVGIDKEEIDYLAGEYYRQKFVDNTGTNVFALTTKTKVLEIKK